MADIFKTSIEAGRESRSRGQTGEAPGGDASLGVMADGIRLGRGIRGDMATPTPAAPTRNAIAPPPVEGGEPVDILAQISARPTRDPEEMKAEAQAASAPSEPTIADSAMKGLKSVKVTWDFLANKLETAVTGDGSTTAPILQQSVEEYKAMASDPKIQELIRLGNDAPDYYTAGKEMLSYAARNPGLIANFIAEQGAAVVASLPLGGVGGRAVGAVAARTALSQGAKEAVVMGGTGAAINSSAVVLGSLGTNYVEGLDKFKGDKDAAADYAATKTLSEVPANAVAGMFLGVNPFSKLASKAPIASTAGNVGFQTAVQGAGGGVGAVQAAQSVGEEAGKGEVLAEIFGEGILAPIDLAQGAREAKRGSTPAADTNTTPPAPTPNTPTPASTLVQDQDFSRLSDIEFQSAIESPAFMAAMYSRADDATRAKLRAASPGLNLDVLVQDGNLVMSGLKMADSPTGPEFVNLFNQAIADYKAPQTSAPFDGGVKVDNAPQDFIPAREKLRLAQNLAAEGQMLAAGETITKDQASAIKAQKTEQTAPPTTYQVKTEDSGNFDIRVKRQADGSVVIFDENMPGGVKEFNPDFARGKSDAQILSYLYEPVGYQSHSTVSSNTEVNTAAAPTATTTATTGEENAAVETQPGPLAQLSQVEQQIRENPRFGLPSTISAADNTYVVEVGPTGKKRKDKSPVNAFVSHKGKVIKVDAEAIVKQYSSEPWTAPKVEGVSALPKDTFNSPEQWLDFVFKHEAAHIANPKKAGEATGAYENRINEIALVQVKGQDFANSVYKPAPAVQAESTPAPEATPAPVETPAAPTVDLAASRQPRKRTKRVKFEEVKNDSVPQAQATESVSQDNKAEPIPENKPDAVEPKTEQSRPQQNDVKVQRQESSPVEVRKTAVQTDEAQELVGPTRDRLYFESAERLDLIPKILEKYEFAKRDKQRQILKTKTVEELRAFWEKVRGWKTPEKPKFDKEVNQFDDDTGGVMSNMARSGAMGLDAISELGNKERAEAARAAQLREEVAQSTKAMNTRAKDAAKGITDPELKALADTQQQEISGTTVDGFLNPLGAVGLKPEFNSVEEVTQAEIDAVNAHDDAKALALKYVEAVVSGEMTSAEAKRRARDEGVGTFDFINALRTYGFDPNEQEINQSGAISANHTLRSFVRDSGYSGLQAREMWLKSYDNLTNKDAVELTKTEQAAYDNWKATRTKYKNRLAESVKEKAQYKSGTLEEVFPSVLFTQFSLKEMQNPGTIDGPMQAVIKDLFQDPTAAWFDDIATVLTIRPDFESQVNDLLTKEEQQAFQEYRSSELREAFRNADMITKSPAYSQLSQLRFLSPELYAEFQSQIRVAEQRQFAQILHEAAEMNDLAKEAIEAGVSPDNSIDAQMREYMLRDEQMSKPLDEMTGEDGTALYKRGNYSGAVTALTIQEHLTSKFAKWETKPEYSVVQNANQLPLDVKARLTSRFDNGAFKGALDPKTGHIYVFSDFVENAADAEFVMFHELYGHWGMRAFLGTKIDSFLETQYKLNKTVAETADRLRKEAAESGMPMGKLESVEEAISDIAASGDTSLFRQIVGKLITWLKSNGFDTVAKWMDKSGESELAYVLGGARRAARGQGISPMDGAPSDVRYAANNLPVEVFATRDEKTTGYARINPITGYWTVFTINDLKSGDFSAQTVEDYQGVVAVLKKVGTVIKAKDRASRVDVDPSNFVEIPDTANITGWRRYARIAQIKVQNMYLPIFEVADFLTRNGKQNDVISTLKRYEGKTKYFVDQFETKYQAPIQRLLKSIGDKGGDIAFVDNFLLARHAAERNKVIKSINPKNPNGSGMGAKSRTLENGTVIPGYTDVLNEAAASSYSSELNELGKLVDKMSKDKVAYMLSNDLISAKQAQALNSYEHYVNLSGNEKLKLDQFDASVLGGRAFNLRGADAKRALGRGTLPVDILQNTMNSYLATVIRGQKNSVTRSILDMVENNPDPTFAVVEQVKEIKKLNTERLLADKTILNSIGDSANEVSGKQFLESVAFRIQDGQITADEGAIELRDRIREAEARRDIDGATADAAIRRINDEVVVSGLLSPDGYVTMVEDTTIQNADNVLVAKINGKPVRIIFQDKGAEFIQAVSGMSMQSRSDTLNAVGAWGRFFSQLVTSWNPAWVPVNGIRDFQTALSNMATDPRVGSALAKQMAKEWTSAYRTAFRYQVANNASKESGWWGSYLNSRNEKYPLSGEEAAMYEEFRKSGAETFFLDRQNLEETLDKMNRHMNGPSGILDWTQGKMEGVGAMMELMTLPMETAPRFAVYKTLRKNGWSIEDAGVYAKELTVNFNLKGSSQWIRSLFVFANPSIQGTYRLFQDYSRGEKGISKLLPSNRFAAVMGGWMMLGMLGNFLARGLGGEDDDLPGVDKLDQVPHHKRSTAFIIAPDVPGMAMPIGYGINVFFTLGHYLPDVLSGRTDADKVAGKVLKTAFDAFAPIGSGAESKTVAGTILKTVTPSIAVPLVELGMNENRFGAPIFKSQSPFSDVKESNAYMHFDTANPISRSVMRGLNEATGGTRYKSGLVDVNPAVVDQLISSYLPGLINEAYKGAGLSVRVARGEDTKRAPIPLVDRLTARVPESWDAGAIRRAKEVVDTAFKELTSTDTSRERRAEIRADHPGLGAAKAVLAGTDQQIKQIRQQLEAFEKDPRKSDDQKVAFRNKMKAAEQAIQNRAVNATLKAGFKKELIEE